MSKKVISLLLAVMLCVGLLPFGAFAEPEEETVIIAGEVLADDAEEVVTEEEIPDVTAEEEVMEEETPVTENEETPVEDVFIESALDGGTVSAKYLDASGNTKTATGVTELTAGGTIDAGWYILSGEIEIGSRITFRGAEGNTEVHLILADGADVTVNGGIGLIGNAHLTIYAQPVEKGTGKLTANGVAYCAGIDGNTTINGGIITATGGEDGAGIGSGYDGGCGDITVNGGVVTATGNDDGAGIGTGIYGECGDITVNGGVVTATGGGHGGAGIGSSFEGKCGDITVNGGVVTATGSKYGAGIGSGMHGDCVDITITGGTVEATGNGDGAGIGSSYYSHCGVITVSGGVVEATGGDCGAAGIGGGYTGGTCDGVEISGGCVTARGGDGSDTLLKRGGAGIGSGGKDSGDNCGDIRITGGWVKAKAGDAESQPIGHGESGSCGSVTYDEDKAVKRDGWLYVNYEPFPEQKPTCTKNGHAAYFLDYLSGKYYSAFPFTEAGLIGDKAKFDAWYNEGDGVTASALGHVDEDGDGECDRCHDVPYYDYDESSGTMVTRTVSLANLTEITEDGEYPAGWYILSGEQTLNKLAFAGVEDKGEVHLILADGADITVNGGILLTNKFTSLTVYSQPVETGTGKLTVQAVTENYAGIGCGGGTYSEHRFCGDITINGGVVTVTGSEYGAGIGSGFEGECGDITVNGGTVEAAGDYGAGIGSGRSGDCGDITVNGGAVTATGGAYYAAGIGSGEHGSCGNITVNGGVVTATGASRYYGTGIGSGCAGSCGDITITDGAVKATGGKDGAGIGGSCGDITITGGTVEATGGGSGAGIGSTYQAHCGVITITGGVVEATGGSESAAGIGSGYASGTCDGVAISGGRVTARGGGHGGAGIGTGAYNTVEDNCAYVRITGGWVKAKAGTAEAQPIGHGENSTCGTVSYDEDKSVEQDGWLYVNYAPHPEQEATCTEGGHAAYFLDYLSGKYYSAFPFTEAGLIGDKTKFDAWYNEGDGFFAALGHVDENRDGICDRCHLCFYYDTGENSYRLVEKTIPASDVTVIDTSADTLELQDGWYIVAGTAVDIRKITVKDDVHLILADGSSLTAQEGVELCGYEERDPSGNMEYHNASLTICVQSFESDMGALDAKGTNGVPGIGGDGLLTINGGRITAKGGSGAAGIGGGKTCTVAINDGVVTATGGDGGAGIGGNKGRDAGAITISGGTVDATGGSSGYKPGGAGIGGGANGSAEGQISIGNAVVTAKGGNGAAGIGGGCGFDPDGNTYSGGDSYLVSISNSEVEATGGGKLEKGTGAASSGYGYGGAGIGAGNGGKGGIVKVGNGSVKVHGGPNSRAFGKKVTHQFVPHGSTATVYLLNKETKGYELKNGELVEPALEVDSDGVLSCSSCYDVWIMLTQPVVPVVPDGPDGPHYPIDPIHPHDPIIPIDPVDPDDPTGGDDEPTGGNGEQSPKTGDTNSAALWFALTCVSALGAVVVLKKKKA